MADRVGELLASMTLDEKVAQLSCAGRAYEMPGLIDGDGRLDEHAFTEAFPHGTGQVGRVAVGRDAGTARRLAASLDRAVRERSRGVGPLFNEEGVHGLMAPGATVFPAALALAATWDTELAERVYAAVAAETRARGSNYVYAPVLDLARDPRWGRVEETFGEDPHLVGRMGVAAVHGLQGRSGYVIAPDRVLACAKHFVGHGIPQAGANAGPVQIGERELREDHLEPFATVIREADVGAVMAAYHDLDGIPVHVHRRLLTDVLRGELGFEGMTSSDGFGIPQLATVHRVAADASDAARRALVAGVDCEVPEPVGMSAMAAAVRDGVVAADAIDAAARRVLRVKDRLGLLDPRAEPGVGAVGAVDAAAHDALALEAARRSLVLLADGGVLPLDPSAVATLAVSGPNAEHAHLGGYSDPTAQGISVLAGLRRRFGEDAVVFDEGCRITDGRAGPATWWRDEVALADPRLDDHRIERAMTSAADADVAVVVVGGNEATHREGWWFDHLGDRDDLALVGRQDELVERIGATATPTVAVVISAGPVDLRRVVAAADAVLWTCYLGQSGGTAIAEVLSGDHDPGGRLPVTFPRSAGQIPLYSGRRPSAGRGYLHGSAEPLFGVGHGLTYTTFDVSLLGVSPAALTVADLDRGATFEVTARVTNTGPRVGSELVRVTVDDTVASVTRPRHRLRGFRRVRLEPGESTTITMPLGRRDLAMVGPSMQWIVEPGGFDVAVHPTTSTGPARVTVTVTD